MIDNHLELYFKDFMGEVNLEYIEMEELADQWQG
jgi:hypothetical protein